MVKYYLVKRRNEVLIATLLSSISALLSIVLLAYINTMAGVTDSNHYSEILYGLGLLASVFVGNIIAQTYLARFGSATIAALRRDLSERYLHLDYEKLLEIGKHQVTGSLVADVARVATLFLVLPMFFSIRLRYFFVLGICSCYRLYCSEYSEYSCLLRLLRRCG